MMQLSYIDHSKVTECWHTGLA